MLTLHPTHRADLRLAAFSVGLLGLLLIMLTWVRMPPDLAAQIEYLPVHGALECKTA